MADRVDKQWKDKGLSAYSTPAIIGTLNHYGIALDEAALKAAMSDKSPLELAGAWKSAWKGTGQFLTYPYAAVNELIVRFYPDRPTPMRVAGVVLELIAQGLRLIDGKPSELEGPLKTFEGLAANFPPAGEGRDAFLREFVGFIEAFARPFNDLPERLTKAGHTDFGLRFALVQEALFLDRKGCVTAIVRAAAGEREPVIAELAGWAAEPERDLFARYSALDALYQLDAWEAVKAHGLTVFDAAAAKEQWTLADSIAHLLAHMTQQLEADPALMHEVESRLELAHAHSGGHHHH